MLKKASWSVIALMSGTSLDGVDLAYIQFNNDKRLTYKIIASKTIPYSTNWKNKLSSAFNSNEKEIKTLNIDYGAYLGLLVTDFIKSNSIDKIDFVASHGHTIFHKPEEAYTLQIGDGETLAKTCQQKVVCDFRTQDVKLGGQGAPLVPIGDEMLFSEYDYCLNIGGFANISFNENGVRKAFDICPANIILNHYTRTIGLEFDAAGALSKSGNVNNQLLQALDLVPSYFNKNSLGNEIVQNEFIPLIDSFKLKIEDILHTVVEHVSCKIASELKSGTALITGGGAYNSFLIDRIKKHANSDLILPISSLIDYKEALIFGLLGLLRIENEVNCLASVTKASKNHSSGKIFAP